MKTNDNKDKIEKIKKRLIEEKQIRMKNRISVFENLKPFKTVDDIPDIPILENENDYKEIVVKNLIRCGAIPKNKLEIGKTYLGNCRNSSEGIWDGEKFHYLRHKFGTVPWDEINHFEDDDGYDLFVPIKEKNAEENLDV